MNALTAIFAADKDFLIGFNSALGYSMPWGNQMQEDLNFFRKTTAGACVIMGRKTAQSIGHLLPGRLSIIFSRKRQMNIGGQTLFQQAELPKISNNTTTGILLDNWESLFLLLNSNKYPAQSIKRRIFLIGGADLLAQALNKGYVYDFYLTCIEAQFINSAQAEEYPVFLPEIPLFRKIMMNNKPIKYFTQKPGNLYFAKVYYFKL